MLLHPVGVIPKAAIVGANARFNVDDVPRLGAKDAQNGSGVHRARPNLDVVRLPDETALLFPVGEQAEDYIVEGEFGVAHKVLLTVEGLIFFVRYVK